MARPKGSTTKSADVTVTATVEEKATVADVVEADIKIEKETKQKVEKKKAEPLNGTDEIEVVSLCPNVFYTDKNTGDEYAWEEVGHVEYMTFDAIKNMWRNHKAYFRNMLLKPNDRRVIESLGVANVYDKYEFLLDVNNYTRDNLAKITGALNESGLSSNIKSTVITMFKDAVTTGMVSDIAVIRSIERIFNLDLVSLL